jgi:integrase
MLSVCYQRAFSGAIPAKPSGADRVNSCNCVFREMAANVIELSFRFTSSSPYIFAHTGEARNGERIATLRFAFHKAATAAKIPEAWRVHDLRHRRVTTWLGAGKSPVAVQAAMGHSTITTTMGYFTLLPSHLAQLVDELPSTTVAAGQR